MSEFTLQTIASSGVESTRLNLKKPADAWPHVERAARRLGNPAGVRIRVFDDEGGMIILTSASAVLMSPRGAAE
jgi:hypothetical protein